jgi:hypothetical protein
MQLAPTLVKRYASQHAYEQALTCPDSTNASISHPIPAIASNDEQVLQPPAGTPLDESEKKPHVEAEGFNWDRVLANSALFLEDFGWWIEATYAIPEGDIGRVSEILKVGIYALVQIC